MKERTIRTPDQRLRVFVSSTLGELADERIAARDAIEQIRLAPVMFELSARPHPPRALYRAYLEQSDVFVGVYWQRYGWVAPDMEISGLEDEFRLSAGMPRLVYVKEPAPDREPGLLRLLGELETADTTSSYKLFREAGELRRVLADDLAIMLTERFVGADPAVARVSTVSAPQPATPLVGRDNAIAEVVGLLLDHGRRLVTLTGVGGIGKTRLALAVLAATADRWRDGAVFVDLSSVRDAAAVLDVVATTCGARPEGTERASDALTRRLEGCNTLLVLDNFEQVIGAAPEVADLLRRCPGLSVLVTSRTVLRVRGEREQPVEPLPTAPKQAALADVERTASAEMFVQRACDVRPSFALTADNAADVGELCRHVDGVPLALELAAARMRLLSPRQVLDRLHERLDSADGFTDLPERQRTLTATLDWSYDLLEPPTRALFARLSVFTGPFTLDAAEAVCGLGDLDAVEELSTLVDHSLVAVAERPSGEPAFRLLETVRAYAAAKIAATGEADAVFERLMQHVVDVLETAAPKLSSPEQASIFQQLEGEVENVLAVMGWAIGAGRPISDVLYAVQVSTWLFWIARGKYRRFPPDLPGLIRNSPLAGTMTDEAWADVYFAQAGQLFNSSRFDEVVALLPRQIPVVDSAGRRTQAALMRLCLAASRPYEPGGPAGSEFERALELVGDADQISRAYILVHLGSLLLNDGDVTGARAAQEESLEIAEIVGDPNLRAESHFQLAHTAVHAREVGHAGVHVRTAAEHYLLVDHLEGKAYTLGCLAGIAERADDPGLAARLLGAAAGLREPIDLRPWPLVGEIERRYAERARAALHPGTFEEHFASGQALSAEKAIQLGLATETEAAT